MSKKLSVIGSGFLGSTILKVGKMHNFDIIGTHVKKEPFVDIRDKNSIEHFLDKENPNVVINCAAFTNVDEMEKNSQLGFDINFRGVENLVKLCSKKNISIIQISSDAVFDGNKGNYSENESVNPVNEYAKSKVMAEKIIEPYLEKNTIVRTNFYGNNNEKKFLFNWILDNLKKNNTINGFDDVFFNPLEVYNLSEMIIEIAERDIHGILHLSSNKILSKYQFAKTIAKKLDFPTSLIKKFPLKESHLFAKRPLNTSLSNLKMKKVLKIKPIELNEWLVTNYEKLRLN